GLVRVEVDPGDGTLTLTELTGRRRQARGVGRLVDGGDTGDTYNFDPPAHDTLVERPDAVEVDVLERGPLRARVQVVHRSTWPEHVADERRVGAVQADVRTTVELQAGSPLVRVTV